MIEFLTDAQMNTLNSFMKTIASAKLGFSLNGTQVKNRDLKLFVDDEYNLFLRFYTDISSGSGVTSSIVFVEIDRSGNKNVLNNSYAEVDLINLFESLTPFNLNSNE